MKSTLTGLSPSVRSLPLRSVVGTLGWNENTYPHRPFLNKNGHPCPRYMHCYPQVNKHHEYLCITIPSYNPRFSLGFQRSRHSQERKVHQTDISTTSYNFEAWIKKSRPFYQEQWCTINKKATLSDLMNHRLFCWSSEGVHKLSHSSQKAMHEVMFFYSSRRLSHTISIQSNAILNQYLGKFCTVNGPLWLHLASKKKKGLL